VGDEIQRTHFGDSDFARFSQLLARETALLRDWFAGKRFSRRKAVGGLELEGWLIDRSGIPQPVNEEFLERAGDPTIVGELAKFNFEVNVTPQAIAAGGLRLLEYELADRWHKCRIIANSMGLEVVSIGVLPTIRDEELCPANMTSMRRYRALNEQLLRLRHGRPVHLAIAGREHLATVHTDMMLEGAATSFQVHIQAPFTLAARYWNAATILSAPAVALAANAPFLFGKQLWEETRIPLYEQAFAQTGPVQRVTFGSGYVNSLEELFIENQDHYPVILPQELGTPPEKMAHLKLHNGTLWRWNRPLVGFDDDGRPHLRVEHRAMAAGPTIIDMIANMAFVYGLAEWLVMEPHAPELRLPFASAKQNFYEAARLGLDAAIDWYDGKHWNLTRLFEQVLAPQARLGLRALHADEEDIDRYMSIIEARIETGRTGAAFQKGFAERYHRDFPALVRAYVDRQTSGEPVHTWRI
jgi:gamma-glutamyl:cysteine ligase YbdK (ATP-grasp superfamily)